jgi:hypothetical protein
LNLKYSSSFKWLFHIPVLHSRNVYLHSCIVLPLGAHLVTLTLLCLYWVPPLCNVGIEPKSATAKVEVLLLPMVNRPVCLGVRQPSGAHNQIFIAVRHL